MSMSVRKEDLSNAQQTMALVDTGRTRIYYLIAEEGFPPPIKIGRKSFWITAEVKAWSQARIDAALAARAAETVGA